MVKVEWHPKALEDLQSIYEYIQKDSTFYANILMQKIDTIIEKLKKFAKIGRVVPEIDDETIREIIIQNYRIIYSIKDECLEIIAVKHSRQQFRI